MTNIKNFDSSLLSIAQIPFKSTDSVIYHIKYLKNLDHENTLSPVFNNVDTCIEKNYENKYFIFASTDKSKKITKKLHRTLG